ncbi:MAG: hypothetical protein H7175_19490, partial [Burkholderiales bacterium]|nr:hypothetical protein [Anaerolineae bacterium]
MNAMILDGSGQPAPERISLRAGPLTMLYEAGMLRSIRLGTTEIVRGIYAAVRDHNWGTVPAVLRDVNIDARADSFDISFTSDHQQNDIHFVWRGTIIGASDGTLRFAFDGEALTSFKRNRVGFCVLHPMEIAGSSCGIEHIDGAIEHGVFPVAIAPHQPFFDIRAITHEVTPGLGAEVRMDGDTFEMEDQRNWIDASFKTYCTSLELPIPVTLLAGSKVRQSVTLRLIGQALTVSTSEATPTLRLDSAASVPLPSIGLGVASHGEALTEREIQRLKALNLTHLRVDLEPQTDVEAVLQQASDEAKRIGCPLEIAVHVSANIEEDLARVATAMETVQPQVARLLVYNFHQHATRRETIDAARHILNIKPFGSGTDAYFTQLNRNRPTAPLEWLTYSINPQVHAFDNPSLIETTLAAGLTVTSARAFSGSAKIAVTPITFKWRWSPDASAPEPPTPAGQLPKQVDVRQMSLFGAVWTLGMIKSLALAKPDSLTFYETTGWRGVMEREAGSPVPEKFASVAGGVFPMYHVFADVGEFAGGELLPLMSSDPLAYDGFVLRKDGAGGMRVLLANYTPIERHIKLEGLHGRFALTSLDETTADEAVRSPETFRARSGTLLEIG